MSQGNASVPPEFEKKRRESAKDEEHDALLPLFRLLLREPMEGHEFENVSYLQTLWSRKDLGAFRIWWEATEFPPPGLRREKKF